MKTVPNHLLPQTAAAILVSRSSLALSAAAAAELCRSARGRIQGQGQNPEGQNPDTHLDVPTGQNP